MIDYIEDGVKIQLMVCPICGGNGDTYPSKGGLCSKCAPIVDVKSPSSCFVYSHAYDNDTYWKFFLGAYDDDTIVKLWKFDAEEIKAKRASLSIAQRKVKVNTSMLEARRAMQPRNGTEMMRVITPDDVKEAVKGVVSNTLEDLLFGKAEG